MSCSGCPVPFARYPPWRLGPLAEAVRTYSWGNARRSIGLILTAAVSLDDDLNHASRPRTEPPSAIEMEGMARRGQSSNPPVMHVSSLREPVMHETPNRTRQKITDQTHLARQCGLDIKRADAITHSSGAPMRRRTCVASVFLAGREHLMLSSPGLTILTGRAQLHPRRVSAPRF
nr:hypothetical protein CFP56_00264 [Quercus suber]